LKAYTSTSSGAEIRLNQLHKGCNSRINYKKTCPIHGEVTNDEIVSGYEYSKDQYVIVDTDELDKIRTEDDKAIKIDVFIKPENLDPVYYNGKNYYLVPDGPVGQRAYSVVYQALVESKRFGVAQVVFHGKEQVGLVRPMQGLLVLTMLNYDPQVTKPATFSDDVPHSAPAPEELQLAKTLIASAAVDEFDMSRYKDKYVENLSKLIEAKVAGQELVAPPVQEPVQVINLMDALKQSVAKMQKGEAAKPAAVAAKEEAPAKPPKKTAPSKGAKEEEGKRRKKSS
jgi:DNA end-binding protein Ku